MSSVVTPSTLLDYIDVHAFPTTSSRTPKARRGFWSTLMQYVTRPRTRQTYCRPQPYALSQRLETPADLLARQYPTLYLHACLGV